MNQSIPTSMCGIYLTHNGDIDALSYRTDIPVPQPTSGEVLIKVAAAGVNNTDINTRTGWYSKQVREGTNSGVEGYRQLVSDNGTWNGQQMVFPRIQGADCCGYIVAVGEGVNNNRIGERVLVRSVIQASNNNADFAAQTLGSEHDGAFAQYMCAPSHETFAVNCDWSDVELASIPCAYSTAENMLHRANIGAMRVLITGASGGVGSAAVQLCKRRGATIIAQASTEKHQALLDIGVSEVIDRNANLLEQLEANSLDAVIDLVAGSQWSQLLDLLKCGGRYVTAGAIAGPIVECDVRTLYLKDLTLFGCTWQDRVCFENLVDYIEKGEIQPLVSQTYPLQDIVAAQQDFIAKKHFGKLVLIPPQ